jgi:hypothetical protein
MNMEIVLSRSLKQKRMDVAVTSMYELDLQGMLFADEVNTIIKHRERHTVIYIHELSRHFY